MLKLRRSHLCLICCSICLLPLLWNIGVSFIWRSHDCSLELRQSNSRPDNSDAAEYDDTHQDVPETDVSQQQQQPAGGWEKMQCLVNDDYFIDCRRDGDEVYIPFNFINKYFEIQGKVVSDGEKKYFDWQHSFSNVYYPNGKYMPDGVFMSFEHYNVEVRDRVKCISGVEGVPISTQWGSQGYYYPIQIAQYGLSHYSKYLLDTTRVMSVLEDGESGSLGMWQFTSSSLRTVFDKERNTNILEFNTHESVTSAGVKINLDSTTLFFLSLHIKLRPNASCTVVVETKARANDVNSKLFSINYISDSVEVFRVERQNIYYGIGDRTEWTWFVRDISLDLQKALANRAGNGKGRKKAKFDVARLVSLSFHGVGRVDNITLANNAHLDQFMAAADWLVTHQDINGGWPIMVTRKLANDMLELPPGWYSAMAQGQAMSVLVRAFTRTKDRRYLNAALHATKLFDIKSADGGVLAKFADKYAWYEEYPTVPSCFVLNGFIYSLIGLYDLKTIASSKDGLEASRLYSQGFESLKALLLLYDTGSGTIYDLRHFTLGLAPNIARWDYHTTHINQLLLLATVEDSELLQNTAKRWIGYMKGHRAAHN